MKYKIAVFIAGLFTLVSAQAGQRLVTAGGSLTEIIYALDAQHLLVGVDSSSHFPAEARKLPDIGYFRALNVEGVLSVKPDQLLLLNGAGPLGVIDQLKMLGMQTTIINQPKTIPGLINSIQEVAKAAHREAQGKRLIDQVNQQIDEIGNMPPMAGKRAVFLMSAGERGLVAAGKDTTPQLIFDQLGIRNPFAKLSGFKPVSAEAIAADMPDIILLASHTSLGTTVQTLCQDPQLTLWAQKVGCRLHKVDSLKFIGLTPRLPQALKETHQLLFQYAG